MTKTSAREIATRELQTVAPEVLRGAYIALVGPDGTGKTTLAKALFDALVPSTFTEGRYYRKTFRTLPRYDDLRARAARLVGKPAPAATAEPDPSGVHSAMVVQRRSLRSTFYPAWHALDMCVSRRRLERMLAEGELIIFDRSFYDCYLRRGNQHVPLWFLDALAVAVPSPDLAIYVERDPEEIYAAKPELTLEELRRQQAATRQFLEGKSFACIIDGRGGADATAREAVRHVQTWVNSKARVGP